jgi:hypothetical protein
MSRAEIVPEEKGSPGISWKSRYIKDLSVQEGEMMGECEGISMGQERG